MARHKIGKLRPRYSFLLNPYTDVRLSKCPKCRRPTHPRKFALLIQVKETDPLVLGKTCRYCSHCEIVIAHQDELEAQLTYTMNRLDPKVVGNPYLVLGTIDQKVWKESLGDGGLPFDNAFEHIAEFKGYLDLEVTGGWGPA
jgi:hypothetical protein